MYYLNSNFHYYLHFRGAMIFFNYRYSFIKLGVEAKSCEHGSIYETRKCYWKVNSPDTRTCNVSNNSPTLDPRPQLDRLLTNHRSRPNLANQI